MCRGQPSKASGRWCGREAAGRRQSGRRLSLEPPPHAAPDCGKSWCLPQLSSPPAQMAFKKATITPTLTPNPGVGETLQTLRFLSCSPPHISTNQRNILLRSNNSKRHFQRPSQKASAAGSVSMVEAVEWELPNRRRRLVGPALWSSWSAATLGSGTHSALNWAT